MDILATVHSKKKKKTPPCTQRTSIFSWSSYRSTAISTRHSRSIIIIYAYIVNNISIPSSSKINFLTSRTFVPSVLNSQYFYCYCVCV